MSETETIKDLDLVQAILDGMSTKYGIRNYTDEEIQQGVNDYVAAQVSNGTPYLTYKRYMDEGNWGMAKMYLIRIIVDLEREIKNKYCE